MLGDNPRQHGETLRRQCSVLTCRVSWRYTSSYHVGAMLLHTACGGTKPDECHNNDNTTITHANTRQGPCSDSAKSWHTRSSYVHGVPRGACRMHVRTSFLHTQQAEHVLADVRLVVTRPRQPWSHTTTQCTKSAKCVFLNSGSGCGSRGARAACSRRGPSSRAPARGQAHPTHPRCC